MNINRSAKTFCKLATLLSDMAHRTMFGLMDPNRFDIVAARISVNGAKDMLYYGIMAVHHEAGYCENGSLRRDLFEIHKDVVSANSAKPPDIKYLDEYVSFLGDAADLFNDTSLWEVSYGGPPWGKIAEALKNVAILYKKYLEYKNTSDEAAEEKAIRNLLIYMNVFDGLAHNNGSIYSKLTRLERDSRSAYYNDLYEKEPGGSQFDKINRLRDISESHNPERILREVEKHLDTKLPYKDTIQRIRDLPAYTKPGIFSDIEYDISITKLKKQAIISCGGYLEIIENKIKKAKEDLTKINYNSKDIAKLNLKNKTTDVRSITTDWYYNLIDIAHNIRSTLNNMNYCLIYDSPIMEYLSFIKDEEKLQNIGEIKSKIDDHSNVSAKIKQQVSDMYNYGLCTGKYCTNKHADIDDVIRRVFETHKAYNDLLNEIIETDYRVFKFLVKNI